jgi:hypothetical protein
MILIFLSVLDVSHASENDEFKRILVSSFPEPKCNIGLQSDFFKSYLKLIADNWVELSVLSAYSA